MIPNNTWTCGTTQQQFVQYQVGVPSDLYSDVYDIKIGPNVLSQSNGKIDQRYWMLSYESSDVVLYKASDDNVWSNRSVLFSGVSNITDISLAFDGLGRPSVFYRQGTNLVLWFYDSQAGMVVFKTITNNGVSPVIDFDYKNDTGNPEADMLMFYIRNDTIYSRLQRDRFDIEYSTGVSYTDMRLDKAGITVDNRFQLTYSFKDNRDGSLLHRKCLESNLPILNQMQNNNFEVGFTIAKAPTNCELRKLYNDYGMGANGEFCIVSHSGDHQGTVHPNEEHLFTLEFMYENFNQPDSDIVVLLRRTPFAEGYYLTSTLSNDIFSVGDYRLLFEQDIPIADVPYKRIRLMKNGVAIIDETVPDLPSLVGNGAASRNRLRFGANVEYNTVSLTRYKNLYPAVFTNIYTVVNSTRTDWFKQYSDMYIDSTPSGNPLTLRKNGDDSYIFSGGMGAV